MKMLVFRWAVIALTIVLWRPDAMPTPPMAVRAHADDEVRGLWVLRTSLTSPERIAELVRTATAGGYNTLLVQVRGRGDAYYRSGVDPRASDLSPQPGAFDPLAATLDAAHAAGLKVHAWINVNLVASATTVPRVPGHVVVRHPEWLMVPRALAASLGRLDPRTSGYVGELARWTRGQSDAVEGLYLSPIPEASQDYTVSVVQDLMRSYALDGAHLDYIRYPSADFDYSRAALSAFRATRLPHATPAERDRLDRLARTDVTAWAQALPETWDTYRRERLTTLVTRLRGVVKAERPGAVLSSAVVPDAVEARTRKLQDWTAWARDGLLDVICPMAYATTVDAFAAQVAATKAAAHGRPVWAGIGAWRLPVGQTADHLHAAREAGARGVLLFSYDSLLATGTRGAYFTQLRPALVGPRTADGGQ
jgi:uncharacterized lipoprotein YddW (UPF0748 family)